MRKIFSHWRLEPVYTNVGEDHIATRFLECVRDCYLFQHVKEYTRIRSNSVPTVLDLIFTKEENMISDIKYNASLGKSDHLSLSFDFKCYSEVKVEEVFKKLNFFKGKYMPVNAGLGGSVGCAVRLETRRARVQPQPRSATYFRGD